MEIKSNCIKNYQELEHKKDAPKSTEDLLVEIDQHMKSEEYNLVLECIAKLIENNVCDAETMYVAAYSYLMLGDYEQAAAWCNNTLTCAPNHLRVRLLLGHLCLLHDRLEDAMMLYEYVLERGKDRLTPNDIEEITEIGKGYVGQKAHSIEIDYPEIFKLI